MSLYPLNRSEQGYLALDGLSGAILQPYVVTLNKPVDAAQARRAARALLSAFARLRAVTEPGLHLYALRVLPDDALMDELFDLAWREVHDVDAGDPAQLEAWHNRLLNEVVSLERGLGVRFYFVPHAQTPLLVLSVHHILLDGRSMVHALSDLLKLLNGHAIAPRPMEAPSLIGAIAPRKWHEWPARLWASWRHDRAQKRARAPWSIAHVPAKASHHYSANAVLHHELSVPAEHINTAAKQRKTTVNTLMLAALAEAVRAMQSPEGAEQVAQAKQAVVIRMSVDLRPFFRKGCKPEVGNYVGSYTVAARGKKTLPERVAELDQQARQGFARFVRREMSAAYLLEETFAWFGRTLFSHLVRRAMGHGVFDGVSCHLSTLGALDGINAPDATIRAVALHGTAVSMITVLVGFIEFNGRITVTLSWQLSQRDRQTLRELIDRVDVSMARLVADAECAPRLAPATSQQPMASTPHALR